MQKIKKIFEKHTIIIIMTLTIFLTGGRCLIKSTIGIPCPSCGLTRAWKAFLTFDLEKAFYYNPLFLFIPIVLLIFIYFKKPLFGSERFQYIFIIIVCVIVLGVYVYRMYLYFPSVPPMDFNHNSILGSILDKISMIIS